MESELCFLIRKSYLVPVLRDCGQLANIFQVEVPHPSKRLKLSQLDHTFIYIYTFIMGFVDPVNRVITLFYNIFMVFLDQFGLGVQRIFICL